MEEAEATKTQGSMLRWILGLVAGGVAAVGGWTASRMASDQEFVRKLYEAQQVQSVDNTKAINGLAQNLSANTDYLKRLEAQTSVGNRWLEKIAEDQARGAWRTVDPMPPAPSPTPTPRPEQP